MEITYTVSFHSPYQKANVFAFSSYSEMISFAPSPTASRAPVPGVFGNLMNFADLHELLRLELLRRIEAEGLTGARLAQLTGFRQAHISNFLNRKRALSLEGLNRVLEAQNLSIEQLLPIHLEAAASPAGLRRDTVEPSPEPVELVPVVAASTAMSQPRISLTAFTECLHIASSRLGPGLTRPSPERLPWQRFVALRVDAPQAAAMRPLLPRGSLVVLDRHYTSLAPHRPSEPNLYAVRSGNALLLRYVDLEDNSLILRPLSLEHAVQLVPLTPPPDRHLPEHLIGRVCLQIAEL